MINIVISHVYPLCRRDDSAPRRGPRTPSTPREEIHDIAEDYTSDGEIAVSARGGGPRTPPGPGPHTPPGMVILLSGSVNGSQKHISLKHGLHLLIMC